MRRCFYCHPEGISSNQPCCVRGGFVVIAGPAVYIDRFGGRRKDGFV